MTLLVALALVAMLVVLVLIPLGLPGHWLAIAAVLVLVLSGQLSWTFGLVAAAAGTAAEIAELVVLRSLGRAYGGSAKAFWAAVAGGLIGLFIGLPVPVVGSLVTAFLGTFVGAGLVTFLETRSLERSARVGWGYCWRAPSP